MRNPIFSKRQNFANLHNNSIIVQIKLSQKVSGKSVRLWERKIEKILRNNFVSELFKCIRKRELNEKKKLPVNFRKILSADRKI